MAIIHITMRYKTRPLTSQPDASAREYVPSQYRRRDGRRRCIAFDS